MKPSFVKGAGLGLRWEFIDTIAAMKPEPVDFLELAPENWIAVGGQREKQLRYFSENFQLVAHGLSLSVGAPVPLDETFIKLVKQFIKDYHIAFYSEHLSYCSDLQGQLYDLFPIPFTEDAIHYVAKRIRRVQDILEQKIAIENISYYYMPLEHMREIEFINGILEEADCELLLDVNNVYVNSVNHHYDATAYIKALPRKRVRYIHIAGHFRERDDLIIDTHGADIINPVWQLLELSYQLFGNVPTLLERDDAIPELNYLLKEIAQIRKLQSAYDSKRI